MYYNPRHQTGSDKPARVQAALEYLRYCDSAITQCDVSIPARQLTPAEARVRESALRVLDAYFLGEMDFGDAPPRAIPPESGDEGNAPVPQPA